MEPGKADPEVDAREELDESGHPDPPEPRREIDAAIAGREFEQLLRAVNEITRAQSEEPKGKRHEL
jgi:hypothetical protein